MVRIDGFKLAVTIRISPSKPQVIYTSRRRATVNSFETTTPVYPDRVLPIPCPHTPPPTLSSPKSVFGLGRESIVDKDFDELHKSVKARPTWTQTTPNSNLLSTATLRRVSPDTPSQAKAITPRPAAPDRLQLTDVTSWIIMELEASLASIPPISLRLDSPVILQICLPPGQRRVPRQTLPTLPLNGFSGFDGPLSSHPTHSPFRSDFQATSPPNPPYPTHLRSLRTIFPHASSQLLSSLQATYLALHYVSTIHLPSPSSFSSPFYAETHSPFYTNMPYIPAKARAMLGLQTPTTRPGLPASWTRLELRGWRERIENLDSKLRREVVRFIRMCEGSDLGENEALVRAVGEIIDFEQEISR